jgi:hypothetical protein
MSNRPCCITRVFIHGKAEGEFFWPDRCYLCHYSRVRKFIFIDLPFSYSPALQFILASSLIEWSPYRNCKATFKRASYDLDVYLLPVPRRTRCDRRPDTDSRWPLPPFHKSEHLFSSILSPTVKISAFASITPQTLKTSALAMQHRDRRPVATYLRPCTSATSSLPGLVIIPCLGHWSADISHFYSPESAPAPRWWWWYGEGYST